MPIGRRCRQRPQARHPTTFDREEALERPGGHGSQHAFADHRSAEQRVRLVRREGHDVVGPDPDAELRDEDRPGHLEKVPQDERIRGDHAVESGSLAEAVGVQRRSGRRWEVRGEVHVEPVPGASVLVIVPPVVGVGGRDRVGGDDRERLDRREGPE